MPTLYRANPNRANQGAPLHELLAFAKANNLTVTSGEFIDSDGAAHYTHSGHNSGSLHYVGRAIDVSAHQLTDPSVINLAHRANLQGINLFDERERPAHGIWTGPHLHLSISPMGSQEV